MTALRCSVPALLATLLAAAPASAAVAPGAVTFPVEATSAQNTVDAFTPGLAAARPDGSTLLAGADAQGRLLLVAVGRDGSLDRAFGRERRYPITSGFRD